MEGEKKGNTAMLTVIAIATLLVAVVGATFAYFSASTTNNASVTVQAETKAADTFEATGGANISLDVTAASMQKAAGKNDYTVIAATDSDNSMTVSLKAGSGQATCTYDVVYTPTTAYTTTANATAESLREFDISGVSSHNAAANNFSNVDAAGSAAVTLKTGATITDSGASDTTATVDTWTFTANYYNLAVDQSLAAGKTFGGTITVTNVSCSNANN